MCLIRCLQHLPLYFTLCFRKVHLLYKIICFYLIWWWNSRHINADRSSSYKGTWSWNWNELSTEKIRHRLNNIANERSKEKKRTHARTLTHTHTVIVYIEKFHFVATEWSLVSARPTVLSEFLPRRTHSESMHWVRDSISHWTRCDMH